MLSFEDVFGREPEVRAAAPGRVNLIGEHTDYSGGFVLPTVTPQTTRVELALSRGKDSRAYSATLGELAVLTPDQPPALGFGRYVDGCLRVAREEGVDVPALEIHIDSDVPIGAGLSSSAALEVAVLRAVREALDLSLSDADLALWAQRAEVDHVGVRCGILDQMASSVGRPGHMLFLDTRSLENRRLPLPAGSAVIVIDSGTPRQLGQTAYNTRRAECEEAARLLGVPMLRDVAGVDETRRLPSPLEARARHVVTENARVLEAVEADAARFGMLMTASHASLRDDFAVSTPALDGLVASLLAEADTFGARLTGAGFGGACVALVSAGAEERVSRAALESYAANGGRGTRVI